MTSPLYSYFLVLVLHLCHVNSEPLLQNDFLLLTDSAAGAIYQVSRDGEHVIRLDLNTTNQVPVAVDYDPDDRRIYWTDVGGHAIWSSHLDSTDRRRILQLTSKSSPEGVAIDPVAGLVFYTDQGQDVISIMKIDGSDRRTLLRNVDNPRSIRVDPRQRRVYWADWGRNTIERMNYDGSDREVLYQTNQSWINGLDLDLKNGHVYWVDAYADVIRRMDIDGQNMTLIVDGNITLPRGYNGTGNPHFYGIALDDEFIYVTDWDRKGLFAVRKNGSDFRLLHSPFLVASGLVSYRSTWYIKGHTSPCNDVTNRNGGCSNLCVPTPEGVTCMCPDDMKLAEDGRKCDPNVVSVGPDVIWLEHDKLSTSYIMGMSGEPSVYLSARRFGERWSIRSPLWHWTSVDNDYRRNKLYLADKEDNLIVQLIMTKNLTIDVIHFGTSSDVNGIAVDWIGHNVYWTDALFKWIIMAKAVKNSPVMRTVVSGGLDKPHGIAVWPQKGLLLWTDWGSVDKIESSTLSGSERRILVNRDLNTPTGLTIDYRGEKVYWCNRDSIEEMNADGTARRRLYTYPAAHFLDVAHYDNYLFVTENNNLTGSYKLWILNTADTSQLYPRLLLQRPPYGVTMLTESKQEHMSTACDRSNCSQLCVLTAGQTAQCLCGDGYDLGEDGKSCKENKQTFVGPAIIYSLGDRLCSVRIQEAMGFIKDPDVNCFFTDSRYSFRALDYDYSSGNIYFSEVKYRVRSIRVAHMKNITDNMAIVQGTGYVYGIAVDYAAGNLYWTDSTHGQIWVSRLDGSLQKILIRGLQYPMGIVIDQLEKKLYWSEQGTDSESGSLKQANLDGSEVIKFNITNVHKPGGVSFDPVTRRLFWVDQDKGTIEYIRPGDVRGHGVIALPGGVKNSRKYLYDVAIFQDFHLYTQWSADNVSGVHVIQTGNGREIHSNLLHAFHSTAYDVIVFSKQYQAEYYPGNGASSCLVDNGGCEQLCLQKKHGRECVCVDGLVTVEETKCKASFLRKEAFFLVADDYRHQIYQMGAELKPNDITAITTPLNDRPIALAYDFTYERVYWTDFNEGVIRRSFLNGSEPETIFAGGYGSRIDGLAFDHESRILYYTDTNRGYIGILNPSGSYHKIIAKDSLNNPRAIVLDTKMGYMYYTVRETSNGRIERRDLTGKNPLVLVSTSLSWPNGLDIDFEEGRLYWVDAHTETIESCRLDGTDRRLIYAEDRESDPFGLAVHGPYVYWTDWTYQGVYRISKHGGNVSVYYEDELRGLNDIRFFNRSALRGANVCSYDKAGCSHFCLSGPKDTRICECPDGYRLHTDGVTCNYVPTCSQNIPNGQIDPACSRELEQTCSYFCSHGYKRTRRDGITCNNDLEWDVNVDTLCAFDVCPLLPSPMHATVDVNCPLVAVPGTSCVHQCDVGYIQVGGDTRRNCTEEKRWTGQAIICMPVVQCAPLDVPEIVIVSPQSCVFSHSVPGQICEQKCKPGYHSNDNSKENNDGRVSTESIRVCLGNSSWNGTDLDCVKVVEMYTKPTVTTPILIGVVIACVSLVLLIILISILLIRRRNKRVARYRASSNIASDNMLDSNSRSYDLGAGKEVNGNSPTYDVRTDCVDLGGQLLSFDNPVYGSGAPTGGGTSPATSLVARQGSLSSESDIAVDRMEFDNPLYDKEKAEKEKVTEVEQALSGKRVQPDLTRELSTA